MTIHVIGRADIDLWPYAAAALIVAHNHPSGDTKPSRADIDMTQMIKMAAKPLGITLHDHIIVGRGVHFSFRSEKLI